MQILVDHPDFHDTLEGIADLLGLRSPPPSLATRSLHLIRDTLEQVRDLLWESATWWAQSSPEDRRFAAAVMALVIGADVCGSIIVREGQEPAQWAAEVLGHTCQGTDLAQAAHRRLVGAAPRPFQEDVAASPTRLTLVSAGCGTGKTVAAYLWAARRLEKRKLFFCYPTTGTTTEGFLDYAFPEFEGEAALVHSRSILDIQCILDNGGDEVSAVGSSHFSRYQGLHPWGAMVTVCTADAVLGLVQNNRVGLIGFPALAGAGFVFDEIHLYDNRMFGALLVFLETIRGTPVLLMTATLPPARRAALLALAQRLSEEVSEVPGPPELEELPRYTLSPATWEEALGRAVREVSAGKRVLWVANTVDRAVNMAQKGESHGILVEPYHSRYRYGDRLRRHRAVVDDFKGGSARGGVLAVTTQVCEVSLDISADLLVTELAPIPALIQRMGRLNRWATPDSNHGPLPALIIEPEGPSPYREPDLAVARRWAEETAGGPRSQSDLHRAFATALENDPPAPSVHSAWLDEVWTIEPAPLREPGATFSVLREEDLGHCLDQYGRPVLEEVIRYSVPMVYRPVAGEAHGWRQVAGVPVAPQDRMDYSDPWGARWR
ncbi:MAG TPA: CRISPR-associated helicase Cas3' [Dehalococcoidia bacterium]|nr:CRISPR-associated helicase Cas3' [Dehalococcoidia bacterium]